MELAGKAESASDASKEQPRAWTDAAARAAALRQTRSHDLRAAKAHQNGQPIRAINEDDDGYDPYSDLHDRRVSEPLFQRDPWQ